MTTVDPERRTSSAASRSALAGRSDADENGASLHFREATMGRQDREGSQEKVKALTGG
jgi:hypothetical protein